MSILGIVSKKLEDLPSGAVPRELEAFSQQLKQTQMQQKVGKHAHMYSLYTQIRDYSSKGITSFKETAALDLWYQIFRESAPHGTLVLK